MASLAISGCGGGGGGFSGFFEGLASIFDGGPGGGDIVETLSSGGDLGGPVGTTGPELASAATVHHPEPASVMLFGGGLAGMAWLRRRTRRRSK